MYIGFSSFPWVVMEFVVAMKSIVLKIHCSEMLPAMWNSVLVQVLPNPTKMFGNIYLRVYIQI